MKSLDRIKAAVNFKRTDRAPVFGHIYGFASRLKQIPLKDYLNSGELMALCQLEAWKRFSYDGVTAFADNSLESEALGSKLAYKDNAYPYIDKYCLNNIHDWKYLSIPDPEKDGRMPVVIEACKILKDDVGEETAVIGTVQGPMTLAGQLMGIEKLIYFLADHPDEFYNLLDFTAQVMAIYGKALIKAGVDVIHVFDPSSSCSVINRAVFREHILPHLKQAFREYKDSGVPLCWLNITGQTEPILDLFPETGADLFNIDYLVPISVAMEKLPDHCINGNIKPFAFVSGEAEEIQAEVQALLKKTQTRGGFILSPGCETPLESKAGNIEAMMKAVAEWGTQNRELGMGNLEFSVPNSSFHLEALSALTKIGTAIGFMSMDLKASLKFLVEETKKLFDAYGCAIFSLDENICFDIISAGPPEMKSDLLKDFENTPQCLVVRDGLPFIAHDKRKRDKRCRGFECNRKVESYACLPISAGGKLVGILIISSLKRRAFVPHHLEMMLSVAAIAASVIQRAQFFHKLEVEKGNLERANKEIGRLNADLKAKIKDLKKAQKQIVQTEKLAMAGRLAAGIAHEVNNPIGVIVNRIECLRSESQEKPLSDDLMNDLNTIDRYAHKISKIVEDLSIFSRTAYSESEFARIDLNDVLDDALFLIEQKIKGKKIELIKKLYSGTLFIQGDAGRLEQVFINIINNSIQAISGSGSITVSTKPNNKYIQTVISDSGTGISEEYFDKLYDPFFTTKDVGKGTGLGLTISHAIVKDHNGSIRADSQIDKGATFTITFPRSLFGKS